ncbi:MAG: hypothetical protein J0H65_16900 [Rhizobiales bacterium]|nr:hypothetical protein [Hyphomicrobiales bacterium]
MSIDYGERERQFLETLKADTGRTLDEWLSAIAAEGLTHRNDIIDWLRRQGFMFSKASWLERIHNNGGRPIYAGAATPRTRMRPQPRPRLSVVPSTPSQPPQPPLAPAPPAPRLQPVAAPAAAAPPSITPAVADGDEAAIDALLARAKAYRPLATYVIAEIRKAVPSVAVSARDGFLAFRAREADFALLAVSAKELRLALTLKDAPAGIGLEPAKLPGLRGAPAATHMAVLTDARQVTPALMTAVAQAASGT